MPRPSSAAATDCSGRLSTIPAPSTSASNYGQVGFTRTRILTQSRSNPTSLTNPFPTASRSRPATALGALTNLDSNISFVDQNRTAPRVQQYSVDLQRELGSMAMTVSYMGARRRPRLGGIERHARQHQPARSEVPGARVPRSTSSCRIRSSAIPTCRCRSRRRPRWRARACCCRSRSTSRSTRAR